MSAVVNSIVTKLTGFTNCATYWAKVGGELAKHVYKSEGLKPPSAKEFETVYQQALKLIKTPAQQQNYCNKLKKSSQPKKPLSKLVFTVSNYWLSSLLVKLLVEEV